MGQAKDKGSLEQRKKQAMLRQRDLLPEYMKCNECGEKITEIIPLQANLIDGINGIGFGICPNCDKVTFGFDTTNDKVEEIQEVMGNINPEVFYPMLEDIRVEYLEITR